MQAVFWLVLVMCLDLGFCFPQTPQRCKSPPQMTGSKIMGSTSDNEWGVATYAYDSINQRTYESTMQDNANVGQLRLYTEKIMYNINYDNQSCEKSPLDYPFEPMEVPEDALFMSQMVLGTSSVPGQSLLVNNWSGYIMDNTDHLMSYYITFTDNDCLLVSGLINFKGIGWMAVSFYNTTLDVDANVFIPPSFCKDAKLKDINGRPKFNWL